MRMLSQFSTSPRMLRSSLVVGALAVASAFAPGSVLPKTGSVARATSPLSGELLCFRWIWRWLDWDSISRMSGSSGVVGMQLGRGQAGSAQSELRSLVVAMSCCARGVGVRAARCSIFLSSLAKIVTKPLSLFSGGDKASLGAGVLDQFLCFYTDELTLPYRCSAVSRAAPFGRHEHAGEVEGYALPLPAGQPRR